MIWFNLCLKMNMYYGKISNGHSRSMLIATWFDHCRDLPRFVHHKKQSWCVPETTNMKISIIYFTFCVAWSACYSILILVWYKTNGRYRLIVSAQRKCGLVIPDWGFRRCTLRKESKVERISLSAVSPLPWSIPATFTITLRPSSCSLTPSPRFCLAGKGLDQIE